MSIKEIQESGLLEYYVLGLLSEQDVQKVEGYLVQYPQLQEEYLEIQKAMQAYASAQGITPKVGLEQKIISEVKANGSKTPVEASNTNQLSNSTNSGSDWKSFAVPALLAAALFFSWSAFKKGKQHEALQKEYKTYKENCESQQAASLQKQIIYANISTPNNRTLELTPTDGYKETNLLFHYNEVDKRNYIQIKNLPEIENNLAFQLWSLKDGVDPIPLTVFKAGDELIIPVDFEEGTGTYAIPSKKKCRWFTTEAMMWVFQWPWPARIWR